jgi:hypothetical protein
MATKRRERFATRLRAVAEDILIEFVALLGSLLTLYAGQRLTVFFFQGALLFGRYPKEYLFDAGDIALICCFTIRSCQKIFRQ